MNINPDIFTIVNKGPDQSAKCNSDESKESLFAKGRDVDERNTVFGRNVFLGS